jgi:hypothetical protein
MLRSLREIPDLPSQLAPPHFQVSAFDSCVPVFAFLFSVVVCYGTVEVVMRFVASFSFTSVHVFRIPHLLR